MTLDFAGLDPCVHCGFCLQSCPTFVVTGDEADSPRGRIVLMQQMVRGELEPTDRQLITHLDRCLGCRACEPACPSGVAYGDALEAARQRLSTVRPVPLPARIVHAIMGERALRRPALALARLVRPVATRLAGSSTLGFAMGMLAATRPLGNGRDRRERLQNQSPANPSDLANTAVVFTGCIMEGLFAHVHAATARVLRANGFDVVEVPDQACCGALHAHAGQHDAAVQLARLNVAAFAEVPNAVVAVNSAGCGAMIKNYGRTLAGDPAAQALAERTHDVTEVLASRGPRAGARLPLRVAYDPPCHLQHAQRVVDAPQAVLAAIPELRRVHHAESDLCCGSAGSYSLTQSHLSRAILDRKISALGNATPDVVISGNPGCAMQIGAGLLAAGKNIPVMHPVELLDRSYERAGYYQAG